MESERTECWVEGTAAQKLGGGNVLDVFQNLQGNRVGRDGGDARLRGGPRCHLSRGLQLPKNHTSREANSISLN